MLLCKDKFVSIPARGDGSGSFVTFVTRLSRTFRDRNKKTDMGNMTDMLPCKVKFAIFWPVSTVPESFVTFVTHFPVSGKTNTISLIHSFADFSSIPRDT